MANKKTSGEDKLFKSSPEFSWKRAMIIVNLILAGRYDCKPADLEARVILLCKDASKHLCSKTLLATIDRSPSATLSTN
jgi:hypothetical protein